MIDDNVGEVLGSELLQHLSTWAGVDTSWPESNAGLAHAYGYLFANRLTPYGWKRDRWLDGDLAHHLGVDARMISPVPPEGTLLGNLTTALDVHLKGVEAPWFVVPTERVVRRLIEEDPSSGVRMETALIGESDAGFALVYSYSRNGGESLYITAFAVDGEVARGLLGSAESTTPLRLRYNAVVPEEPGDRCVRTVTGPPLDE
ncbi:UNVERIFIED_CONTAM: hypothetical protein DES50_10518 [Williamsia faeni]